MPATCSTYLLRLKGRIGLMTITCLLQNTLTAFRRKLAAEA